MTDRALPRPLPTERIWRLAPFASVAAILGHILVVVLLRRDVRQLGIGSNLFLSLESIATVILGALAVRRFSANDTRRKSLVVFVLAVAFIALAHIARAYLVFVFEHPPRPSLVDVSVFMFYWTAMIGLLTHPASATSRYQRTRLILELAAVFLGAAMIFWMVGMAPVDTSVVEQAVLWMQVTAYPASAAALLAVIVLLLQRRVRGPSRVMLRLLCVGAMARLVSDVVYSVQAAHQTPVNGWYIDLGYSVMLVHFALAFVWRWKEPIDPLPEPVAEASAATEPEDRTLVTWSTFVPLLGVALAFALLVWAHFNPVLSFTDVAIVCAIIVALFAAREMVVLKEIGALYSRKRGLTAALQRSHDELDLRVRERTSELAAANAALQGALAEKDVLLQEVHHRVKNNLQMVSSLLALQARSTEDARAAQALVESEARLHAMGLIHQKLYTSNDLARVNLADYMRSLVEHLLRVCDADPEKVRVAFEMEQVMLPLDTAVHCGLIINELVLNAIKHAFPHGSRGVITVGVHHRPGGFVELRVRDDGIGLPPDLQIDKTNSLGLKLVRVLVRQIDATLKIDRGLGTTFTVTFCGVSQ